VNARRQVTSEFAARYRNNLGHAVNPQKALRWPVNPCAFTRRR
jgi:hypothetical protein